MTVRHSSTRWSDSVFSACGVVHAVSCMLRIKGSVQWTRGISKIWPCEKFDLSSRSSQEVNFDRDVQQWIGCRGHWGHEVGYFNSNRLEAACLLVYTPYIHQFSTLQPPDQADSACSQHKQGKPWLKRLVTLNL